MVVCKYYLQGCCNFGARCRYEHTQGGKSNNYSGDGWNGGGNYNRNQHSNFTLRSSQFGGGDAGSGYKSPMTFGGNNNNRYVPEAKHVTFSAPATAKEIQQVVSQDIEQWERGNQWLLSCYAPLKEGENFPGFVDVSPEELRWNAYQAQSQGTLENYKQEVARLELEVRPKRQLLKNPTPQILEIMQRIFKREKLPENLFDQAPKGNAFGSSPKSEFHFKLPQQPAVSPPSLFTSPVFGSAPAVASPPAPPPNPTINSGFYPNQVTPVMNSLNPSPGGFGVAPIGNPMTAPSITNPIGFGIPTPTNVAITNNPTSNFSFKLPSQTVGSPPMPQQQPSNVVSNPSGMGSAFSTPHNTSLFRATPDTTSASAKSTAYTPLANLSEEQKQAFEASTFTLGKIPEIPPPIELCR